MAKMKWDEEFVVMCSGGVAGTGYVTGWSMSESKAVQLSIEMNHPDSKCQATDHKAVRKADLLITENPDGTRTATSLGETPA